MKPQLILIVLLFAVGVIFALDYVVSTLRHPPNVGAPAQTPTTTVQADASGLPVLWDAPDFAFADQNERMITQNDLLGHVWITDFIFTTCTIACPPMTAKMVLLQREVPNPDVRFVCFSVDPAHDTSPVLKQYAESWNRDESRWILLHTDPKGLLQVAAGMKVAIQSTGDARNPIFHSSIFLLVDRAGHVRGIYNSSDGESMKQLAADARLLSGTTPFGQESPVAATSTNSAAEGAKLFQMFGCQACHSQPRVAPPLNGLFGREVKLDDGSTVRADDSYIRESILVPGAKVVAGYSNTMPSYQGHITGEQVEQLIAYFRSNGAELLVSASPPSMAPAGAPKSEPTSNAAVDPVCQMTVRGSDKEAHVLYAGKTQYFCSEQCRQLFLKNPMKYWKHHPGTQSAGSNAN